MEDGYARTECNLLERGLCVGRAASHVRNVATRILAKLSDVDCSLGAVKSRHAEVDQDDLVKRLFSEDELT